MEKEAEKEKCFYCDGTGEYCFPEAAATDMADGWYTCDMCSGTGFKPVVTQEEEEPNVHK